MDLKILKRLTVVHLCIAISFFCSGIILSLIQGLLFVTLRNVSKWLYRKINYYLCYSHYSQLVFMIEWWAGGEVQVYIDKEDFDKYYGKEHAYLIMNHSYEVDWLVGWQFCDFIKVLGNCKAYAKKSIQYVPPIGWMWKFGEYVFLERSFDKDKVIIPKQINELSNYPDPIWLLLFPEGTRFTPAKHEASQKFSKEKGLPLLKHHLTPRTKGFTTSLKGMRGKIPAIYDIQIAFKPTKALPTMTSLLYGEKLEAHLYINRIPLENVSEDEDVAAKWLHDLFVVKDRMQDSFHEHGDFFKSSGVTKIAPFALGRRYYPLINMVAWAVVILVPMLRFLLGLLFSGELLYFSIAAAVFLFFYFALQHLIGMSKISKASSYGSDKKKN